MAASDYDYIATRNQIIDRAFRIVGVLRPGQVLSGGKLSQGLQALQSLIKFWQTDVEFPWTIVQKSVSLVAGTISYSLGSDPKIIGIDQAMLVNGTEETNIEVISWRKYNAITDKNTSSDVTQVAVDGLVPATMYVYANPSAAGTLNLLCLATIKDLDSASALGDFPPYWEEALTYGLADSLCDEYSIPISEKDRLSRKALDAYAAARRFRPDRPDDDFVESAF